MRRAAKLPKGWFYCRNCFAAAKTDERRKPGSQFFCKAECRREFWRHGGVSVHRLKQSVLQWMREELPAMVTEELRKQLPGVLRELIPELIREYRGLRKIGEREENPNT
jgi:hypothetical protein